MELEQFTDDFASALQEVDRSGAAYKKYQPGIGAFSEPAAIREALKVLKRRHPDRYKKAAIKRHPDLLIPNEWQIEFKVIGPYNDNGQKAEHWSQNVLHPYRDNTSSIGDCLKLLEAKGNERKAVVVFGYEHGPAIIPLDPCIKGFEMLAEGLFKIRLSARIEKRIDHLIHPVFRVLRVFAWEILRVNEREED